MSRARRCTALCLLVAFATGFLAGCERSPALRVTPVASPAGPGSLTPHLDRDEDGRVVLSWLEPAGELMELKLAHSVDGAWTTPRLVARGGDWFVNWADFPSVSPIRGDVWAAHWLVRRPGGTYSYDVAVSVSQDAGIRWGDPVTPHADETPTEHGFVSLFPWGDTVGVLWLDGRETGEHNPETHSSSGGMTLRSARLAETGALLNGELVDEFVCDCCQTDVAVAADGPVAVYRDRSADEVRDVYVARTLNGAWQRGVPVAADGWVINGCPVNGPAVAASGSTVAVAWFTAADDTPRVRAALSSDGGATFGDAIEIDSAAPIGRVDVELLDSGAAAVSWMAAGADGQGMLSLRVFGSDGSAGPVRVITPIAAARSSGFPQMIRQGDALLFAWTALSGEDRQVLTATLPVAAIEH
ncbi:MAG: sialidase family protein [Pseudomonadota bacterium]